MKKEYLFLFPIFLLFGIFFLSCNNTDEECRMDRYVQLNVGFYKIQTDSNTQKQSVVKLYIDSIDVWGLGMDSLLYNNKKAKDSVSLPLNKFAEQSDFVFSFNKQLDTVSIFYTNQETYLSFECGFLNTFLIDSLHGITYTQHYIDSIKIVSFDVNTTNVENLQIYHTSN